MKVKIFLETQSSTKPLTTLLGQLSDLAPAMPPIRDVLLRSVRSNFRGGRLVRTGRLLHGLEGHVTPTSAFVVSNEPYSRVQQWGGAIRLPQILPRRGKVLRFQTADGRTVFTRRVRPHIVRISGQRYMFATAADVAEIQRILEAHILRGQGVS